MALKRGVDPIHAQARAWVRATEPKQASLDYPGATGGGEGRTTGCRCISTRSGWGRSFRRQSHCQRYREKTAPSNQEQETIRQERREGLECNTGPEPRERAHARSSGLARLSSRDCVNRTIQRPKHSEDGEPRHGLPRNPASNSGTISGTILPPAPRLRRSV